MARRAIAGGIRPGTTYRCASCLQLLPFDDTGRVPDECLKRCEGKCDWHEVGLTAALYSGAVPEPPEQETRVLRITAAAADPREIEADLLVVPVFKAGIEGPGAGLVLRALGLESFPVTPTFRGDIGQTLLLSAPGITAGGVLLVGIGRMDESDPERLRAAAGTAARAGLSATRIATTLAEVHASSAAFEAVAEGFLLGAYRDLRFRSEPPKDAPALREVVILTPSSRVWEARAAIDRAEVYARATMQARDLVNLPPDRKRPPDFAQTVVDLVGDACEVRVRDRAALAREGFGGILAVGRGSDAPPCLVELRYRPENPLGHVALVGKGITFDSGGLSLKRAGGMRDMKSDLAGAAAIAAVCAVLRELDVRVEVTGLLACAENMPGGDAQRPGDVLTMYGGTTVEVRDTDAEGRLVLGDALAYAAQLRPDAIVDLATLTGTAIQALGPYAAPLMGNDEDLLDSLRRGAAVAGEAVWPLPLWEELDRRLDSPIADLNNLGDSGSGGGAIIGGLFLQHFVGDVPWAHLDIAGPAFVAPESTPAGIGYLVPGGTGFGVRTLLAWLERRGA